MMDYTTTVFTTKIPILKKYCERLEDVILVGASIRKKRIRKQIWKMWKHFCFIPRYEKFPGLLNKELLRRKSFKGFSDVIMRLKTQKEGLEWKVNVIKSFLAEVKVLFLRRSCFSNHKTKFL